MNTIINTIKMNFKFGIVSLLVAIGFLVTSCVGDDDFRTPTTEGVDADIDDEDIISVSALVNLIDQNFEENPNPTGEDFIRNQTLTFLENKYVEGYVISSDQAGNFFRELIIQDLPSNPTAGVTIIIDINPLFGTFEPGRKVYLKLDGLTIGRQRESVNGIPQVGIEGANNRIERIQEAQARKILIRENLVEQIEPKVLSFSDFNVTHLCQAIRLENVQFPKNLVVDQRISFAGEPSDQFDAERVLESCENNATATFATSTFADYKSNPLPQGAGAINTILLRNFDNNKFILKSVSPTQLFMDQERCDPEPLCEGPSGGPDVVFEEDFEDITNIAQLTGWVNVNTEGGTLNWRTGNFNNNTYAQVSGFNSGQTYDAWLVTPEINLGNSTLEEVRLDIEAAFDNGAGLSVLITENYTGDVLTTEWQELEGIEVPQGPSSGFGGFSPAGVENISCLENIRFAFRYQGSDPDGVTTRYHIDNLRIVGQNN